MPYNHNRKTPRFVRAASLNTWLTPSRLQADTLTSACDQRTYYDTYGHLTSR
jgi:hypothetical protein